MAFNFPLNPTTGQTYTNPTGTKTWIWTGVAWKNYALWSDIVPLDNLQYQFDGIESRFYPTNNGVIQSITNPFMLLLSLNGIIQNISFPEVVWGTPFSYDGFTIDSDGYIAFSEPPPAGSTFFAKIEIGPTTQVTTNIYPFRAIDILLGAY